MAKKTHAMETALEQETNVVPSYVADIETASDMFVTAKLDELETSKDLKGNEQQFLAYSFERDGERITGKVTSVDDIGCIQRIRVASKVETASRLVISANIGHMINNGAFDKYGVTSAEKLNDLLGLGLSQGMASKCSKVGKVFLDVDANGIPVYKDGIPHLPVSSLDYLAAFVDEIKDDEKKVIGYNYDRLADFIEQNGITDSTSQGTIKKLLPKKEGGKKTVEGKKETAGQALSVKTRAGYLTRAIEALSLVEKYITNFADIDDTIEKGCINAIQVIGKILEQETSNREEDMTSDDNDRIARWEQEV